MNVLFLYIVQSTLSLTIFYIIYELLFKHEAYFSFNRYYFLVALIVSAILPAFDFSTQDIYTSTTANSYVVAPVYSLVEYTLSEVVIYGGTTANPDLSWFSNISSFNVMMLIYLVGVIVSFCVFVIRVFSLSQLVFTTGVKHQNGINYVFTKSGTPVFSFFKYIFIDKNVLHNTADIDKIIEHEKVHINQNHSVDIIIAEFITILQWFNPLAYLLKNALKENHEFLADENVIVSYPDVLSYSRLLIDNSSIVKTNILTHNFSYSLLKRRLFMIKKTKSLLRFSIKVAVASMAMSLVFFACSGPGQNNEEELTIKPNVVQNQDSEVYKIAEVLPKFPGGVEEMMSFIGDNVKYPTEALNNGVEGTVFLNFIVEKDGSVDSIKVLRGVGSGCDKEAIRVIKLMPNWKPGIQKGEKVRVSYNIPIKFALNESANDTIYNIVESMPEFPGGPSMLMSYLSKNINYPEKAKKAGVHGRVFVSFVVEADGSVTGVKLLRGIGSGCDEEAIRVVSNMPRWTPGTNDNKPVRVRYNIPLVYSLN